MSKVSSKVKIDNNNQINIFNNLLLFTTIYLTFNNNKITCL